MTVGALLSDCQSASDGRWSVNASFCAGFVAGTASAMATACEIVRDQEVPSAVLSGGGFSNAAATQTFVNWAKANPQNWGWPFTAGIMTAISEKFPCQRNSEN